ncbi:MAG: TlpA family protein disulfide reductase [Firmicutes bacterium]|jgi:peroxiredoxin|nr:TlpA family protein disulfide reductase [Bacillota bacterium]MCL5992712.1 TlpA family protein disulfide reductase [Bacillota bacterium]
MKKYTPMLIMLLALAAAILTLSQFRSQEGLSVGQAAPEFTLNDFEGNPVSLADLRGKVVLLNFWSAACPPCREKMPTLQQVYEDLQARGFTVLAINVNDRLQDAQKYLSDNGYTFPALKDADLTVARMYAVTGIPKTLMLDRSGIIRDVRLGPTDEATLRRLIEELL